ncbi:MAG: sugar phosphate isomerase/epimerase [Planctomycetes bacterium]|nr:sugar phosphate isomerase/epimerase [Planctomycetota bacterium]
MNDDARAIPKKTIGYDEPIKVGTLVGGSNETAKYIEQILAHGFESFSITFWQTTEGRDLKAIAADVKSVLAGTGVTVSSLGIFGNPLADRPKDLETRAGWERCIDAAHLFDCDIVAGFAGRLVDVPLDKSIDQFKTVFAPLAARAQALGVRLAFENCDMGGTWRHGDWNLAHSPDAWEMMFNAVPAENIGLEWEPCHQMVSLIDPIPQLRKWAKKVFHVHGKDATVLWDVIKEKGIRGNTPYVYHRTPGFGDSNWSDIITILRMSGFKGSIDIEGWHDPVYNKELEMTGQVHALKYLKSCRGGAFVPNPV